MNGFTSISERIEYEARTELKIGLSKCTEGQQHLFKQMYSFQNMNAAIDDVVDNMPAEKLDWAMQQVQRSACPW